MGIVTVAIELWALSETEPLEGPDAKEIIDISLKRAAPAASAIDLRAIAASIYIDPNQ